MSHLLQVESVKLPRKSRGPMVGMSEFPANPDLAPYLVTSSKDCLWIEEAHESDGGDPIIRVAIRSGCTVEQFFLEVVESVMAYGKVAEWGNVHPLTKEGIQAAIDHVQEYGLGDVDILIPKWDSKDKADIIALCKGFGVAVQPSSWMPDDCVVVVPKKRGYVGGVFRVDRGAILGVVHNAARGIAIATERE